MWAFFSRLILRNRITILVVLALCTVFMGYNAQFTEITYEFPKLLPDDDSTLIAQNEFNETFGEEGNILILAVETDKLYELETFNAWYDLGNRLENLQVEQTIEQDGKKITQLAPALDSVFSVAHLFVLERNDEEKKFDLVPLVPERLTKQSEVDTVERIVKSQVFYEDLLYNEETGASLMMCFLNEYVVNTASREVFVDSVKAICADFSENHSQVHYSGLPYIRTAVSGKIRDESPIFIGFAAIITALILLLFFRSLRVMAFCMVIVGTAVVWSLGSVALFDFKITGLMSLIPPLVIVIGIPNCIYLLNKYHQDIGEHGNQIKSLSRVIQKIGNATFMTNATTAMGFATFIFTQSDILIEFGVIASINIMVVFMLSITIIPIVFSFLAPPTEKQTRHLKMKWIEGTVEWLVRMVTRYRPAVYVITVAVLIVGGYGITLIETTGNPTDDLPEQDDVKQDLRVVENNFSGVMPFEIVIDTKREKHAQNEETLERVEAVQELFRTYDQFSKSVSVVDAIKFARHSFYGASDPENYRLIKRKDSDAKFIRPYLKGGDESTIMSSFMDSLQQTMRITMHIKDIGTKDFEELLNGIKPLVDSIMNPDRGAWLAYADSIANASDDELDSLVTRFYDEFPKMEKAVERTYEANDSALAAAWDEDETILDGLYLRDDYLNTLEEAIENSLYDVSYTGSMVLFLRGTSYLVKNLFISLLIAVVLIAILMALLFNSFRMVIVSLIPNLIPLILTGSIMGYFGIPIKPSTILVFSIAFGISVDDTIHFLAKYRQELKTQRWNIGGSVINALRETGVSMIYTSIVLFFGFSVFVISDFGGTVALGVLVSITLLVAMLTNLVLLPSLLLTLERSLTTKAFEKESLIHILEEEEDIELDDLEVQRDDESIDLEKI